MIKDNYNWMIETFTPYQIMLHAVKHFYCSKRTKYQKVDIVETFDYGKCLFLDGKIQSSQKDEYIYHELLVHPPMVVHPSPQRVLVIGGGEGATIKHVLYHNTVKEVIMVDIDEEAVRLCEEHLPEWGEGAFSDNRLKLYFADARKFLEDNPMKYDVIIIDITDPLECGPSYLLFTKEFYEIALNRLNSNGVIGLQAGSTSPIANSFHVAIYNTLKNIFPTVNTYQDVIPSFNAVWGFAITSLSKDFTGLSSDRVDKILKERGVSSLKYFDGSFYRNMFNLPNYLINSYDNSKTVISDKTPMFLTV